jgi:hypothetical protein
MLIESGLAGETPCQSPGFGLAVQEGSQLARQIAELRGLMAGEKQVGIRELLRVSRTHRCM